MISVIRYAFTKAADADPCQKTGDTTQKICAFPVKVSLGKTINKSRNNKQKAHHDTDLVKPQHRDHEKIS